MTVTMLEDFYLAAGFPRASFLEPGLRTWHGITLLREKTFKRRFRSGLYFVRFANNGDTVQRNTEKRPTWSLGERV